MDLKHGFEWLLLVIEIHSFANGAIKFTNVRCEVIDKSFCDFEYCYLKAVNRSYQYMSLKVRLHKLPITNVTFKFALSKRANGYRPFLYNMALDACKFLRNENANKVAKFIYGIYKPYTNMNHICPYDHDLIVDKLSTTHINDQFSIVLPFPLGDYRIETEWHAYGIYRANWTFYISLT